MIKICELCKGEFNSLIVVDGKKRNLQNRKYCLKCSPWEEHNTKILNLPKKEGFKTCCKCKKEKEIVNFQKKTGNYLQSYCKECLYVTQRARWIQRKKDAVDLFGGKCSKCGYNKNFSALEFHHRDAADKKFVWNKLRLRSKEILKKELDKCDLLCSNCHQELHNPNCKM